MTTQSASKKTNGIFLICAICILAGFILALSKVSWGHFLVLGGTSILLGFRFKSFSQTGDFMVRRLHMIQVFSTLFLFASWWFLSQNRHEWAVFAFITAAMEIYVSFRYPQSEA